MAHRLRLIGRVVSRIFNAELEGSGLTVSQFTILTFILARSGASPSDVAGALELEKSTVSRNLELMRTNGWIDVAASGRGHSLTSTQAGEAAYGAAIGRWQRAQDRVQRLLGTDAGHGIQAMAQDLGRSGSP